MLVTKRQPPPAAPLPARSPNFNRSFSDFDRSQDQPGPDALPGIGSFGPDPGLR